jgi:hypothetical protein
MIVAWMSKNMAYAKPNCASIGGMSLTIMHVSLIMLTFVLILSAQWKLSLTNTTMT